MGFFSWNCKYCGHPLLCAQATNEENKWMNKGVALSPDGSIVKGEYDGYGRLESYDSFECELNDPVEVYHEACWEAAGRPTEYSENSECSVDQGWFFDEGVHTFSVPTSIEDASRMKLIAKMNNENIGMHRTIGFLDMMLSEAKDLIKEDKNDLLLRINSYLDNKEERENKKEAKRLGVDVDTYKKIKDVYVNNGESFRSLSSFVKIENIQGSDYKLVTDTEAAININIETGVESDKYYPEDIEV